MVAHSASEELSSPKCSSWADHRFDLEIAYRFADRLDILAPSFVWSYVHLQVVVVIPLNVVEAIKRSFVQSIASDILSISSATEGIGCSDQHEILVHLDHAICEGTIVVS